jgi:radical SAM superfamily enzyme YgiQ (UPF0313 family)
MRVLLISANTEPINMPVLPMGLGCVAVATRRAGHEVKMLDLMGVEKAALLVKEAVEGFEPEVIGISVRNIDDQRMENPRFLVDQAREVVFHCRDSSKAHIVLGGSGYSIFPQSVLAYLGADMGIQGEGERAFPILLSRIESGAKLLGVPGHFVAGVGQLGKKAFDKDLDQQPLPDPSLWSASSGESSDVWVPIQTRRGCPIDCSYCSTKTIEGRIIRKRSAEMVADTIVRYIEAGFQRFHFVDNVFNLPPSYAKRLCRSLIERRVSIAWRCILYPGGLDRDLVKTMAKAGCTEASLGFESGSDRILNRMHKRFDKETVRKASEMLGDENIRQIGFLLLGGPGETKASVEESFAFVDSLRLDAVKITVGIRIYPHTALARTAVQAGVIDPDDDLLFPRFYLAEGLENWLPETVREWAAGRPHWVL